MVNNFLGFIFLVRVFLFLLSVFLLTESFAPNVCLASPNKTRKSFLSRQEKWVDCSLKFCSIEHIQQGLDSGFSINAKSKCGTTLLMSAICCNNTEVADFILNKGADFTLVDLEGSTTLHWCALFGCLEISKRLLAMGANPNQSTPLGTTPLMQTVIYNKPHLTRQLLAQPGIDVNAYNVCASTALSQAVAYNHIEIVALLLEHPGTHYYLTDNQHTAVHEYAKTAEMKGILRLHRLKPFLAFLKVSQIQTPYTQVILGEEIKLMHTTTILENPDLTRYVCGFL